MPTDRRLVTLISSDVSQNALSRAITLGAMLSRTFDVEIVGSAFGNGIWPPASGGAFAVDAVAGRRLPMYAAAAARLLRKVRGDVVYAVKLLPTSFGIGLLHKLRTRTPLVVDMDDDELAFRPWSAGSFTDPNGRPWTRMVGSSLRSADAITVATTGLRERHGGVLVPHARDTEAVRPRPEWTADARRALGAAPDRRLVLFVGTPRAHKGLEDLAAAMSLMKHATQLAVIGADASDPYVAAFRAAHPAVLVHPPTRLDQTGFFLQAADAVAVPQRLQPESLVQMPAKLLDAMAAAKPIAATAVGDIPMLLADGRGHVVQPRDPAALARALDAILEAPVAAREMGERARAWCVRHASYDAIAPVLADVVGGVVEARQRRGRTR